MKQNLITTRAASALCGLLAAFALTHNTDAKPPRTVELPAASVDGLAAAIADAGAGGIVLVKSGLHTESGTVVVGIPVQVTGEPGAVIACGTSPSPLILQPGPPPAVQDPSHIVPTLHIKGADDVIVRGLQFVPSGPAANCAVLVEDSDRVQVRDNRISGFQYGVLVQHGNRAGISENTIECAPLWAVNPQYPFVVVGIDVFNGESARVTDNRVSGAFFGIFGNDRNGQMAHNSVSGCFVGFQMCHSLYGIMDLFGVPVGADVPCTDWLIENNTATENGLCGYLVIDGANQNLLVNNGGSGNTPDMILTGEGDFFDVGIIMPASHDNLVVRGTHKELSIVDLGANNIIR